jgi:Cdc6-like AAA superfamily ATPase
MFDVVWPKYRIEVDAVVKNLEKHADLLRKEATVLDIQEAREARVRATAHFTNARTFQERQKFLGLKSRLSPELYDEKLGWFRNRSVADCARWLFRDNAFSEWLDPSKMTVAWFWLQGIPGAGKTYLSATVIDHTRKQHRTLFAFVSHLNKASLTALSVMQSLIFQAADDDDDFQSLLVESKERELQGNIGHAAELLNIFLKTATGPTYTIIDGLDEMDECERQIFLQRLDELSKECGNLRLLISSRAEDDISRALNQKIKSVRVNDRNYGSIQNYIDHRSREWMARHQFDSNTKLEMINLLSPLSINARGKIQPSVLRTT